MSRCRPDARSSTRASRRGRATLALLLAVALGASRADADHPVYWSAAQRRDLVFARLGVTLGQDSTTADMAEALSRERPNDARAWAACAAARGLALAWDGGGPKDVADEVQSAADRAAEVDRDRAPEVVLALGIASLARAARSQGLEERDRALDGAERDLLRVARDARALPIVRFDAEAARFALACEREEPADLAPRLADAIAVGREARLTGWALRRFRELALDRLAELGAHELVAREARDLPLDASDGRKSPAELALVRARALLALGRPQEALRLVDGVPRGWSRGLEVECWLALDRPGAALACARRARNEAMHGHPGDELVGRALLALGRFDDARGTFERALASGGGACARCRGGLALALLEGTTPTADDLALAEVHVRRATALEAEAPATLRARAALARRRGERALANRLLARARAAEDPRAASAVELLRDSVRRAQARERWGLAAARASQLLAARPGDSDALRTLALACEHEKDPRLPALLDELARIAPQDAWVRVARGETRLADHRFDEAEADLERARELLRGKRPSRLLERTQAALVALERAR